MAAAPAAPGGGPPGPAGLGDPLVAQLTALKANGQFMVREYDSVPNGPRFPLIMKLDKSEAKNMKKFLKMVRGALFMKAKLKHVEDLELYRITLYSLEDVSAGEHRNPSFTHSVLADKSGTDFPAFMEDVALVQQVLGK